MMDAESTELIGFGLRSHLRALERLWLLYRDPNCFRDWLEVQSIRRQLAQALMLMLNVLPHIVWLKLFLFYWLSRVSRSDFSGVAFDPIEGISVDIRTVVAVIIAISAGAGIARGFWHGITAATASGLAVGIASCIFIGVSAGVGSVVPVGITLGMFAGLNLGVLFDIAVGVVFGNPENIRDGFIGSIGLGIFLGFGLRSLGSSFAPTFGITFGFSCSRFYYILPHLAFVWPALRGRWYPWHPVAWDRMCSIPLPRFDLLLTNYFELQPMEAIAEIERLVSTYPSKRSSALKAWCRIVARRSGKVAALTELTKLVSQLPRGNQRFLAQVPHVADRVLAITALQEGLLKLPANMPAYRLVQAGLVCEAINSFRNQIAGFAEPLASEFRTAAQHWLKLANGQLDEARHAAEREPFPQVFRAGDPVQGEKAEAFIPRQRFIQELAGLILATIGCPGILLYARRRMGKSTCLQNLMGFIPTNIDIVFLNLQDPAKCGSLSLFCEQLIEAIRRTLTVHGLRQPPASSGSNEIVDFSRFLDDANSQFGQSNRKLLIALDEFESLDIKLGQRDEAGRPLIPEDLLAMFRTSIQSHRNLIWLFSGSHRIAELQHAEWPSYLISVRTVELDRFTLEETSQLLTDPLAHSQLFKGTPNRPKFPPEFWGTDGLQRLHEAADGWPHLVVLLAETCVNVVNLQNAAAVTDELFRVVRQKAIVSGDNVMIQLLKNESEIPGEWDFLLGFRDHDVLPAPQNIAIRKSLLRRSLVTLEDNLVRLRVPLMHQWIRERSELLD